MGSVMTRRSAASTQRQWRGQLARVLSGALAGVLAAAVALGVAELVAGLTGPLGSPVTAVGGAAIDMTPVPVKDFAIAHFGSNDKTVLISGILLLLAVFAAVIGAAAVWWLATGLAGLAVFGALGVSAAVTRPGAGPADAVPTLAGVAVAAVALNVLIKAARGTQPVPRVTMQAAPGDRAQPDRRRFLAVSAGTAAVAAVTGGGGDLLLRRFSAAASRAQVRLPAAARGAAAVQPGTALGISGLTPYFTPNSGFYRVDTDLVVPQVSPGQWTLQIGGMVDKEIELTFADLLRLPLVEHDMTLVCVSNEIGGPYAGNARWLGASLPALLRRAGLRRGADQVLSTATDGMTISTPVATIMDGRAALLAVGMNGQPLPVEHGFPARMIVPGLYGYVSATKWVTRLKVTTFAADRAYWTQRGYAQQAPIRTESRIDVPKPLSQVKSGQVAVAGVAWAPHRGIARVEVNVDGGPWHSARLAAADGTDTWRQWVWAWDATAGLHTLQVRATDGTGTTQTSRRTGVFPSGATGWDSVVVTVT
jgi:DMSO/TMAO reductase YedYZ molybdopterin-dependent catalytic subunit